MKNYQSNEPCICCGQSEVGKVCYHHIITRGAGGSDESWNLLPVCQEHHNLVHMIGIKQLSNRFPRVHNWLIDNDWNLCEIKRTWRH
jgi:hypothetical protein